MVKLKRHGLAGLLAQSLENAVTQSESFEYHQDKFEIEGMEAGLVLWILRNEVQPLTCWDCVSALVLYRTNVSVKVASQLLTNTPRMFVLGGYLHGSCLGRCSALAPTSEIINSNGPKSSIGHPSAITY